MDGPVAGDLSLGRPLRRSRAPWRQFGRRARILHGADESLALNDDVDDHLEMVGVQLIEDAFRFREVRRMPGEFAVARVPAGGRELRAEIDQRLARQLLLAKRSGDPKNLFRPRERPRRLHVPERPERRHFRQARDARVLAHDDERIARRHHKQIKRERRGRRWRELTVCPLEVERAIGLMDEHRPAVRTDQPLNRCASTVGRQQIAVRFRVPLAVAHLVRRALLVELHAALAEAEQRSLRQQEGKARRLGTQYKALHNLAFDRLNDECWRVLGESDRDIAGTDASEWRRRAGCCQ